MAELGQFALLLGFFLSGYAIFADLLGVWQKDTGLMKSGRNATISSWVCLTVATIVLWALLIRCDFSVKYVAENTSMALPIAYRISAFWAGAAGSLLLWLWLQSGFVAFVFSKSDANRRIFAAVGRAIANLVSVFFFLIVIMDKSPFVSSVIVPSDGEGLNPLLQHPAMVLHPPVLFIGYAAFAIPFVWALASLKSQNYDSSGLFFNQAHNWILLAWMFLTIGIVLGAWWAYEVLGWGGYWAWDPVENSSLMPWLTATALLHCSRNYKQRTSIATWLVVLSLVTFSLCIFGTFLTRYGLVSSVHAFPEPGLGILFIVLLIHIWVIAAVLLWRTHRSGEISVHPPALAGYKFLALNNWLMILLTFVIFAGTLFPFFSGLLTSQKISLKPDYFTKITAPMGFILLLLLSICPHLLKRNVIINWRIIGAAVAVVIALGTWLVSRTLAPAYFIICAFAVLSLTVDFFGKRIQTGDKNDNRPPPRLNLRWCGARIVHAGVVLVFIGIAGSGAYEIEKDAALRPNEKVNVAGFDITFNGLRADHRADFTAIIADISVSKGHVFITKLNPSQLFYSKSDKRTGKVDIRRTLAYDLYVALAEVDSSTELINLKVLIKPLINWIWIGSLASVFGALLVLISYRRVKTPVLQEQDEQEQ